MYLCTQKRIIMEKKVVKIPHIAENRGYGISTSKRMLVEGMKGAFFMLSGGAFHRYENGTNDYIDLAGQFYWHGTIILLRIPTKTPEGFNYIDYLE